MPWTCRKPPAPCSLTSSTAAGQPRSPPRPESRSTGSHFRSLKKAIRRSAPRISAGSAASATGLAAGTPVAAGAGDQGAGAVGMGILAPGSVSATIGTSGVVFAATAAPTLDPLGRLHTFCHAAPGIWHVMGVTNGAGLSLRYLKETFFPGATYDELTTLASGAPPASDGLLWAPYLFGERTPHLDPNARAAFVGITRLPHPAPTSSAPCSKAWLFRSTTPSPSSVTSTSQSQKSDSAAAALAHRSGARSRPTSTTTPSNCSKPKKAQPSALHCWPEPESTPGPRSPPPVKGLPSAPQPTIAPQHAAAMANRSLYVHYRKLYPAPENI